MNLAARKVDVLLELASRSEAASEAASLSTSIFIEAANSGNEAASEAARLTRVSLAKPLISHCELRYLIRFLMSRDL